MKYFGIEKALDLFSKIQNINLKTLSPAALLSVALVLTLLAVVACQGDSNDQVVFDPETSALASISLSSPAFNRGSDIPVEFTCDGEDVSPPLRWTDIPEGAKSLAIVMDDPDAPGSIFRHWSVYDIPAATRTIKQGQTSDPQLENTIKQGTNDFGTMGYGGPCPPSGEEHEYTFFIYALTGHLELSPGASASDLTMALQGKVIGTGSFTGMYARQ